MKALTVYATVNTKSNFRNLNGQSLPVIEMQGTRVSVQATIDNQLLTIDFRLSEIKAFHTN